MKIELLYPFVDFRRLSSSKSELLLYKPGWPKPPGSELTYYRSMGQIYPRYHFNQRDKNKHVTPSCIANGIRLNNASIKGLKGINRVIDFKHGTDLFGAYSISFFIKAGTFRNHTVDAIYEDYLKDVKYTVVDLVGRHENLNMEKLKGFLAEQYFWATRRLTDPEDTTIKHYQRDAQTIIKGVGKIVIPTQKKELRDILFLKPYFIVQYTPDDQLQDANKNKLFFMKKNLFSLSDEKQLRQIAVCHRFYKKKEKVLKILANYVNTIKYNFLFFDYLGALCNYKEKAQDDQLSRYFYSISMAYHEAYQKRKLNEMKKVYEKEFPGFTDHVINKLNSSFGSNTLSDTLSAIRDTTLKPG